MKRRGFTLIEVIVSMILFFISLIPLLKYTDFNMVMNRKYNDLEKRYKNFLAIEKQIVNKDMDILLKNLGNHNYTRENLGKDRLTEKIFFPYELEEDFNLRVEISKIYFDFESERYEYLKIKNMYIDSNKNIISEKIVDIYRGKDAK